MTTPKCPICGTPLKAIRGYDVQGVTTDWVAGCYNCFIQSSHFWKTKKECIEDMDRLVSLFPPIMRVQVGDKVRHLYQFNPYRGTPRVVEEVNVQEGWIRATGNKSILRPNEITTWPWEIEQKGSK